MSTWFIIGAEIYLVVGSTFLLMKPMSNQLRQLHAARPTWSYELMRRQLLLFRFVFVALTLGFSVYVLLHYWAGAK
jgi:uncharacterized membrane protein